VHGPHHAKQKQQHVNTPEYLAKQKKQHAAKRFQRAWYEGKLAKKDRPVLRGFMFADEKQSANRNDSFFNVR